MKKLILSSLIFIFSCSLSYGALYNQDNRISIPKVLGLIQNFEKNVNTPEKAAERKNILHKLSIYGARKTQQLNDETLGFIFHMIKLNIGEEKFQLGLNKIADLKDMPSLSWLQILRCFDGINADNFYDAYFSKNPLIQLTVTNPEYITERGEYFISFTLLRKYGDNVINIPYTLEYSDRKEYGRLQSSINREETFKVPVSLGAVKFTLDPSYQIIRELTDNEKSPVIADILNKKDILYIADEYNNIIFSVFKDVEFMKEDEVKFNDV